MIAMAMLDWMVKYMKTRLPPMKKFLPAEALMTVPTAADITVISFRIALIILAFLLIKNGPPFLRTILRGMKSRNTLFSVI